MDDSHSSSGYGYGRYSSYEEEYRLNGAERLSYSAQNLRELAEQLPESSEREQAAALADKLGHLRQALPRHSGNYRSRFDEAARRLHDLAREVGELAQPSRGRAQASEHHAHELAGQLNAERERLGELDLAAHAAPAARRTVADFADAACAPQSPVALLFCAERTRRTAAALRKPRRSPTLAASPELAAHADALAGQLDALAEPMETWSDAERDAHDGTLTRLAVELAALTSVLTDDALVDEESRDAQDPFAVVLGARRGHGRSARQLAAHLAEDVTPELAQHILRPLKLTTEDERVPWPD